MEPDSVHLPFLTTFLKAAEVGSFTGAARAIGLTQAAVSQRIQQLELALGASLFARRGGRVAVTAAGRALYAYAQRIDDLHRDARRAVSGRDRPVAGELDLAASSVPGEHLLPLLLAGFGHQHPHVRVRAAVSDSLAVVGQVERGETSVGLVGRRVDRPHLTFRHLGSDRMVLVAPPDHPLARRKRVTPDHLVRHPLVLREVGSGLRHCFEKELERAGVSPADLRVTLELGSNEAIKEAVLRGIGVAVLSVYAVHKELAAGSLVAVPLAGVRCDRDMFVVQDGRRLLPLPARLFLAYLEAHPVPVHGS